MFIISAPTIWTPLKFLCITVLKQKGEKSCERRKHTLSKHSTRRLLACFSFFNSLPPVFQWCPNGELTWTGWGWFGWLHIAAADFWHQIAEPWEIVAVKISLDGVWVARWCMVCNLPYLCVECHCATTVILWNNYVFLAAFFRPTQFTFLQNGIIWQLFLLRLADCRANSLSAPCSVQQIPFVSADLHHPCLLPSICSNKVNDWVHGSYNNSNQIKVDPCGQLFLCAVILFRLYCCCNALDCYRLWKLFFHQVWNEKHFPVLNRTKTLLKSCFCPCKAFSPIQHQKWVHQCRWRERSQFKNKYIISIFLEFFFPPQFSHTRKELYAIVF